MKSGRGRVFEEHRATDDWHRAFNVGYAESTKEKEWGEKMWLLYKSGEILRHQNKARRRSCELASSKKDFICLACDINTNTAQTATKALLSKPSSFTGPLLE